MKKRRKSDGMSFYRAIAPEPPLSGAEIKNRRSGLTKDFTEIY